MALLSAKTVENLNFKFFQLRKLAVTGALDTNVINNLAISHAHQVIFAAYGNAFKAIRISTLLDYQWDKKLVDSVIASYPALEVKLPYKPLLLSVCGGTNSTLLVFGQNASNNLSGDIFDIPTLLSGNPNPVSRLEFPPAISQNVHIQSVAWHPEFAETLFAATTSNGALVTIGIDQQTRGVQLLSHYTDSFGFTCVSWSPKGKQLVVGGDNGQLTQFKHSNGKGFQKAKAIPAPASMASHKIVNVNWVHSALFQVVYVHKTATDNPDTKVIFIHAPPKVTPEYHNFGNVCMDTKPYEGPDKIRFTFSEIGNVLLCLSSLSNEVTVIGCETTEINPSPVTWQQWSLDDASRIELSGVDGSDAYPVGIAWFKGPTKVFKINDSVSLGGQGWPLIAVLSSNGLLTPYYAYHLQGKFSIPEFPASQPLPISVPGPVRANRPDSQATGQQQPAAQSGLVKSPAQTFPTQQPQPVDSSFTFSLPKPSQDESKPQTSVTVTATIQTPMKQQQPQQQQQHQQQAVQQNQSIQSQQQQLPPQEQVPSKPAISEEELRKKELEVMEETFASAINEEIIEFTKTFENARNNFSKAFNLQIGKPEELVLLQSETVSLFELLKTSSDTLKCLDINMLDGYILETWAMFQEATTRLEKESDPVYTLLSNRRSIDPITARKMREIKRIAHEIEMHLEDLNAMLDREWEDYTAHMNAKRLPLGVSSIDMIYHTLTNHHKTIEMLKKSLSKYDVYLESIELTNADLTLPKQKEIQDIINSLKNTSIREDNNSSILDFSQKSMIKVPTITKEKKEKLLEFFEQRNSVPVRRAILPVDLKSSKMVSAVVKAQDRLKEIRAKSQVNEVQSRSSSSWNNQPPSQPKMVDTSLRVMPNQVTPTKSSERPDFDKSLFYTTAVGDMSSLNDTTRYQSPAKNLNFLSPITSKTDPRLTTKSSDKSLFKEPEPADKSTPFVNKSESKDDSFSLSFSSTTLGNIASPTPSSSTFLFGPSSSVKPSEKGFASTFATATKDISIISKDKDTPISKENIKPKVESKDTITNTVPSTVTTITPVSSTVPASKATAFPAFTFSQFTSSAATSAPVFSFSSASTTAISTQPTTIPTSSEVKITSSSGVSVPSTVTTITPVASSVVSPKPAAFPAFTFDSNPSSKSTSTSAPLFSFTSTASTSATATLTATVSAAATVAAAAAVTSATPQTTTNILTSQSATSVSSNTSVSSTVTTITPVSSSVLSPKPPAFVFDKSQSTTSITATTTAAVPAFSFMSTTTTAIPSQSTTTVPTSSSAAVAASNTSVSSTTLAEAPVSKANVTNSSFSFSAPPSGFSFSGTTTNASSLFGSTTPSVTQSANDSKVSNSTSLFSIEKPANTTGLSFSDATASTQSFNFNSTLASLGGQPTPSSTTTNPFGTSITNPAPQLNLFSPATTAQPSTFGSPPSMSSSFASQGHGVAQTGFGSFSAQNQPRFGAQPTFGGAPAFGNQPTFGGSPTFGTALPFGKTPSNSNLGFGQPAAVATVAPQPVQPTGQPSPFGGFANANTPSFGALASQQAPTFGQLAASTQQQPVVQPQPQPATGSLFGGFGGQPAPIPASSSIFGNSFPQAPAFGSPQFSQRRQ